MRKVTVYPWHTGKLNRPMRLLVVADLHDGDYADILPLLKDVDALLLPGDAANRYRQGFGNGLALIREAAQVVPTFVGVGNHEMRLRNFSDFRAAVEQTPATFLFNAYVRFGELVIGCWYRPYLFGHEDMLPAMQAEEGCKVLLCHRPEDYMKHLRASEVDLVLAGHAHGGQIRIHGQGLYAPGQGLLPKYTYGVVDSRMVISAGATNAVRVPRWGNPCEVVRIDLD